MADLHQFPTTLRIVTFNLLNDSTHWAEHAPLIVEGLRSLQPDVIALQEVRLPDNHAAWIADRLEGYETYLCPKTGPLRLIEGEALLSRLPVEEHAALAFRRQGRVAHRITVRTSAGPCVICNSQLLSSAPSTTSRAASMCSACCAGFRRGCPRWCAAISTPSLRMPVSG